MKAELARGEHKSLQTDRVILMPGPEDENPDRESNLQLVHRCRIGGIRDRAND